MGRIFYGWKVVAACFLCCMSYGTFYSFGIFFKPLSDEFGWSYTLTSSVQSLHIIIYIISSFTVGALTFMTAGIIAFWLKAPTSDRI